LNNLLIAHKFSQSGGPYWNVLKGRKDGRVSKASETVNLPAPTLNVNQLIQSFAKRGLGVKDMGDSLWWPHSWLFTLFFFPS